MTKRTYTHAIVYVGAPYGDNESGHIVSRHTSRQLALERFARDNRDSEGCRTTFGLNHRIVELDANGNYTLEDA